MSNPNTPPPIQGQKSSPEENEWLTYARSEAQRAPERYEETAKYLAGIIAISLTIFLDKRPEQLADWTSPWLTAAAVLWLVSAFLAFFVLFPYAYRYAADSPDSIQRAFQRICRVKRRVLLASVLCFGLALGLGVTAFVAGWTVKKVENDKAVKEGLRQPSLAPVPQEMEQGAGDSTKVPKNQ